LLTVTTTEPTPEVLVTTNSSTLPLVLAFTTRVAEPEAAVAPVSVDSKAALVAVAETVAPAATPETEMLSAFDAVTLPSTTGSAMAVAEVAPPVAETVATVSVWVFAAAGVVASSPSDSAATMAIESFLNEVMYLLN
jgi:hypothetical protein